MKQTIKDHVVYASGIAVFTTALFIIMGMPVSVSAQDDPDDLPNECTDPELIYGIAIEKSEDVPELPEEIAYPNEDNESPLFDFVFREFGSFFGDDEPPVGGYEVRYFEQFNEDQFEPNYWFNMYDYWCEEYASQFDYSCNGDGRPDSYPDDEFLGIKNEDLNENGEIGPYGVQNASWVQDEMFSPQGLVRMPSGEWQDGCLSGIQNEWFPFFDIGGGIFGGGGGAGQWDPNTAPAFAGKVVAAIPCLCSGTWNVYVSPPGISPGVYTYVTGMPQYASFRLPVPPGYWILGQYSEGSGACIQYVGLSCSPLPSNGTISPIVGSSIF